MLSETIATVAINLNKTDGARPHQFGWRNKSSLNHSEHHAVISKCLLMRRAGVPLFLRHISESLSTSADELWILKVFL